MPQPPVIHRDRVYASVGDRELLLDLYLPAESAHPPLAIWIHGGAWRQGSFKEPRVGFLLEHGYALASISYRFSQDAIFPAQIHDCKAAVRWLRAHAAHYGYDPDRIVALGASAGATLALLLGVSAGDPALDGALGEHLDQPTRVSAVVQYYGPADFHLLVQTIPEAATSDQRGSFALLNGKALGHMDMELARQASPCTHVGPASVPLLSFHGTADRQVPPNQAERLDAVYRAAGRPVQTVLIADAGHGGQVFFDGDCRQTVLDFLARYV